ncbi:MAG: hypothetical protein KGL38_05845 [Gemmatimonadota bacterium]|nr:hypothetical protein [Gemmatimonadota bacterium]MDE3173578.1 hypothetical protein [Gemmatimonadota bacterium]MDE3215584.1 hypothetical protein [Gemmatimonadota bacterium]
MPASRSPMQRAFAKLLGGIVALDLVAIGIFEWGHVAQRGPVVVQRYVIGWTAASALVAAWGLYQVKQARRAWRRGRGSGAPGDD